MPSALKQFTISRAFVYLIVVFAVIIINALINLTSFPEYFWDEGVYVGRSINFLKTSQIYQNPHYIDHPPLGWITPSIFFSASGFPDSITHGSSSLESQILLLIFIPRLIYVAYLGIISILVYKISSRLYNRESAVFSLATFALIPALWPFREFLLDPLMILFVLSSIFFIISKDVRIQRHRLVISGILFGCAILTKFTAIFFLPVLILFLVRNLKQHSDQNKSNAILWITPIVAICISYLYALNTQHELSYLVSTQLWQIERGSTLPFGTVFQILLMVCPLGFVLGVIGIMKLLKNKNFEFLLSLPYIGFLFRGGFVGFVHTIPILPILCIHAGEILAIISKRISSNITERKTANVLLIGLLITSIVASIWITSFDSTASQIQAIQYLVNKLPRDSLLVTNAGYSWIIKQYRPDLQISDYFGLNFMKKLPDQIYIAENTSPIKRDSSLKQSESIYDKSCIIEKFENEPKIFHPFMMSSEKSWNVVIRHFDAKGTSC